MLVAECLEKIRDEHGKIIKYTLKDENGCVKTVDADKLKWAIFDGGISVINLTLTSDNKLVDRFKKNTEHKKLIKYYSDREIDAALIKAKMLGLPIKIIHMPEGRGYIVSKSETDHLIFIPSDIHSVNSTYKLFYNSLNGLRGNLKIIGGSGLTSTELMFKYCRVDKLDLTQFDTSNVVDMTTMFCSCHARDIDFSNFNTSKVKCMELMFDRCDTKRLDLSSFDTSNVETMRQMFYHCEAEEVDLKSFDTSKVINMSSMFKYAKIPNIDLRSFSGYSVKTLDGMFYHCEAHKIDLSNFKIRNGADTRDIINDCKAKLECNDPYILKEYNQR